VNHWLAEKSDNEYYSTTNNMLRLLSITTWLITCLTLFMGCESPHPANGPSQSDFSSPPASAKPRVWWHWMNGNITKSGIRKDLLWMHQVGIGGFHNFDANLFTPAVVDSPLVFMTPPWKAAFRFAATMADSLGFEMTIAGSPGWSVTGGPWVAARDGMKKYVWTETLVRGGQTFQGKLTEPSDIPGNFQNVRNAAEGGFTPVVGEIPTYYNDAAVVAYRRLPTDQAFSTLSPTIRSSGGKFDFPFLTDGDLNTTKVLPPGEVGEDFWIQYEFKSPQTIKAMSVVGANHSALEQFNGGPENRRLMVSNDGVEFTEVAKIKGSIAVQNTIAFKATTGRYWRLAYTTLPPPFNPFSQMFGGSGGESRPEGVNLAEFVLYSTDRIDQLEDKAGFTPWSEDMPSYLATDADALGTDDVVVLTDKMQQDGTLNWDVPPGDWVVLRFGYSLTGRQNHPASAAGTGLEVDKLDEAAVRSYINTYLDMYQDATGGMMGDKGLQFMVLDSYEAGHMNWTHDMPEEFEVRRGYSLQKWIPVLTGRIVESREASEMFLWDFRKTIGEMIAENHYDVIGQELQKRNMKRYTESHENRRIYLADGMDVKRNADVPMAAMWTPGSLAGDTNEEVRSEADIRESASVAHIYGKPIVAAESMTSVGRAFQEYPERLKRTADLEMASGLNRFVIHTSVHQPLDDKMPGFSLGPFGQYFSRQETWAQLARPWIDYLARSCYMLQQGRHIADALVLYGENSNITWEFKDVLPVIPGYEYDFVNATALIQAVTAKDGKMTTPGGGVYSVLVLDESTRHMTLPVLRKIGELAQAGVAVTGAKPQRSPSLSDDMQAFRALVDEIWSRPNVSTNPAADLLGHAGVEPDVMVNGNPHKVLYVHRSMPGSDIYWLDSRSAEQNQAEISFRMSGEVPVLWHPETGKTKPVSWEIKDGRTVIPLAFEPWEAYFIVFTEETGDNGFTLPEIREEVISTISSPWNVRFQPHRGAPENAVFDQLKSWAEQEDEGIKYFSGTATYNNSFQLSSTPTGQRIILDLGEVKNLAEITVNGKHVGILWKTPFKADITEASKEGENTLEISVTNLWVNRLIGDAQPGAKKLTFTTMPFYRADGALLPSGLLGPVKLIRTNQ
jgi:hypothetical protein